MYSSPFEYTKIKSSVIIYHDQSQSMVMQQLHFLVIEQISPNFQPFDSFDPMTADTIH